jgi:preprotein translocase subunit SecE
MSTDFQTHVAASLGRIEATLEGLAGTHGRITKLEKKVEWTEDKQWLHTIIVIPVTTALAALIRHLTK